MDHWDLASTKASSLKNREFFPHFLISAVRAVSRLTSDLLVCLAG